MTPIDKKSEAEDGDVAVPTNAAVAANVLSGTPPEPEADTDQGQPAEPGSPRAVVAGPSRGLPR